MSPDSLGRGLRLGVLGVMLSSPLLAQESPPASATPLSTDPRPSLTLPDSGVPEAGLSGLAGLSLPASLPTAAEPGQVSGITKPVSDLNLSLSVAGRIEAIKIQEGQSVKQGEVILYLDNTLEMLEVKRRRLLLEDTARLQEIRAREKMLAQQLQEARQLLKTNSLPRKQVEDEELAFQAVVAERRGLEMTKQREQVEFDLAREALERRNLRAPLTGVVAKLHFRVGESVAPHEPVVKLVDVSRVRFTANVSPADSVSLRSGGEVGLRIQMAQPLSRAGRIVFVSPVTDAASGLVEVSTEFDNTDGSIRPGVAGQMLLPPAPRP